MEFPHLRWIQVMYDWAWVCAHGVWLKDVSAGGSKQQRPSWLAKETEKKSYPLASHWMKKKCVKTNKAGRTLIEEPCQKDLSMYIHFNSQQLLWEDTLITYNLQKSKRARRRSIVLSQEGEKAHVFAWAHPFNRWSLRCSFSSSTNLPVSNEVRGLSVGESRRHPLVSSISINVHGLLIMPWLINTPRTCPYSCLNKDSFINDEY